MIRNFAIYVFFVSYMYDVRQDNDTHRHDIDGTDNNMRKWYNWI